MYIADEITSFIRGTQFNIFTKIDTLKKGNQANLAFVSQDNITVLNSIYESKHPWKEMTKANEALSVISEEIKQLQAIVRNEVLTKITEKLDNLKSISAFDLINEQLRKQILSYFAILENTAKEERFIGNLKAMHANIEEAYDKSLKSINKWVEEENSKTTTTQSGSTTNEEPPKRQVRHFVRKEKAMDIDFSKNMLETEADVEAYIDELKCKMLEYIRQNKNIMLN